MSYKAAFWQQKEINHRLTCTFLTEKMVAMKTDELRTWTAFVMFPSLVIFSPSLSQRDVSARRKKEKKERGGASCSWIVVNWIIIWKLTAGFQANGVWKEARSGTRSTVGWMQLSVAVKTYFIPRRGAQEILEKTEFACILLSRNSPTNQSKDWRTDCETCLMIQNTGIRTKCFHGNISAIRVYVTFPVILHLCKVILVVIKPSLCIQKK